MTPVGGILAYLILNNKHNVKNKEIQKWKSTLITDLEEKGSLQKSNKWLRY